MNVILRPVRGIYRITFNFADHEKWRNNHPGVSYNPGIDFYSDDRSIYSCDAGVVDKIGVDPSGYGNYIKLKHSWGYSLYAHLLTLPTFPIGYEMIPGMINGQMGFSGNVRPSGPNGTHLHFETRDLNQVPFDPEPWIQDIAVVQNNIPDSNNTSKVKIVCASATIRKDPGYTGTKIGLAQKGDVYECTGMTAEADDLEWVQVQVCTLSWIAKSDFEGTRILENV